MRAQYAKAYVAVIPVLLAVAKVVYDALGDGRVSVVEWVAMVVALLTALGVYAVPNKPSVVHGNEQ